MKLTYLSAKRSTINESASNDMAGCLVNENWVIAAFIPGIKGEPSLAGKLFLDKLMEVGLMKKKRDLWVSEADGHMYDANNFEEPFRRNIAYWTSKIQTVADLKAVIRASDKAFGARRLVLWMDDNEPMCHKCARSEFRQLAEAIRDKNRGGWRAIAASTDEEVAAEDYVFCCNCNQTI